MKMLQRRMWENRGISVVMSPDIRRSSVKRRRVGQMRAISCLSALFIVASATGVAAATYYVAPGGSDGNAGTSAASPFATPAKAFAMLNEKNTGGEIIIASGNYALSGALTMKGGNNDAKRVVIRGATGNPADVVLDAGLAHRVMTANGSVTVSSITIANGITSSATGQTGTAGGIAMGTASDTTATIVTNCIIRGCKNAYTSSQPWGAKGAAAVIAGNYALLVDCVVSNNTASYRGCGINFTGQNATARGCTIQENDTTASNGGAPVLAGNSSNQFTGYGRLVNCTVQTNSAKAFAGIGGVGYIEGCTIRGNVQTDSTSRSGCAIYAPTDGFFMTNCVVTGNSSANGSQLVSVDGANAVVADCAFSDNAANAQGGALSLTGANGTISKCRFVRNAVTGGTGEIGGGALHISNTARIEDCAFTGNTALSPGGGAVYLRTDAADAAFANCSFVSNKVSVGSTMRGGGAVCLVGPAKALFDGCQFEGNSAEGQACGGAVMLRQQSGGGLCVATDCTFAGNNGIYGGAFATAAGYSTPVFATLDRCVFTNNSSFFHGGAVYLREPTDDNATPFSIRNAVFALNHSGREGGALYCASSNGWEVANCTIVQNYVANDNPGGGLCQRWGGRVVNTILAGNRTNSAANDYDWSDEFGTWLHCLSWPLITEHMTAANGCINADPMFTDAANGNLAPKRRSPCRNAGIVESWMTSANDIVGNPRVYDRLVDIGCYEYCIPEPHTAIILR